MNTTIRPLPAILAVAMTPLPLLPLQLALSGLLDAVTARHPRLFERLGEHAGKRFGIEPVDLPFAMVLAPCPEAPRIEVVRRLPEAEIEARIAGPIAALVGLAGGSLDGDALFFSRDLAIEGDVAAIVALRNALDDAGVDVTAAVAARLGPLGGPFEQAARVAGNVLAPLTGVRSWS